MGIALFDNNYCWFAAEITQWLLNKAQYINFMTTLKRLFFPLAASIESEMLIKVAPMRIIFVQNDTPE